MAPEPNFLEAGDSFCFPGTLPYIFDNPKRKAARMIRGDDPAFEITDGQR